MLHPPRGEFEPRSCALAPECAPISVAETLAGHVGIVDLWYCVSEAVDAELLAAYEELLTADERARYGHFRFDRDRQLFLLTRALVRTVLSEYAAVAPERWRFTTDGQGRPRVAGPSVALQVYFNLANTRGLVVCAVSVVHEMIGVDVEEADREVEMETLAGYYFAPSEVDALQALPGTDQRRRFFALWTLKESYLKARSLGLALPLDAFSFRMDHGTIDVAFDSHIQEDARRWRFALLDLMPRHMIALAADTGGAPLSLRARHFLPRPFWRCASPPDQASRSLY